MEFIILHIQWFFSGIGVVLAQGITAILKSFFDSRKIRFMFSVPTDTTFWAPANRPKSRRSYPMLIPWRIPKTFVAFDSNAFHAAAAKAIRDERDPEPIFDIVLHNRDKKSVLLRQVGLHMVKSYHIIYGLGGGSFPLPYDPLACYDLDVLPLASAVHKLKARHSRFGYFPSITYYKVPRNLCHYVWLQTPISIPPDGHYRFRLRFRNFTEFMPNHSIVRLAIKLDDRTKFYSDTIFLNTQSVMYSHQDGFAKPIPSLPYGA